MAWALLVAALAAQAADHAADRAAGKFFDRKVAPILIKRCLPCHNPELANGGISFRDRESLLRARPRGAAIVPGDPERSFLVATLRHDGEIQMPPGPKLPAKEIAVLVEWIRRQAVWGSKLTN